MISPGHPGQCRVRANSEGSLVAPWGYVAGAACDPIEKKPFFHVLPGRSALTFGMLGCNMRCDFCQNWTSSQWLRDGDAGAPIQVCEASSLVDAAIASGSPILVSSYNEPLVSAEWSAEVLRLGRDRGLLSAIVTNGLFSPESLEFWIPRLDACKVDLKCFTESGYRSLGGSLEPITHAISQLVAAGVWTEVVTLVVPGFNDSVSELSQAAEFLAGVSRDLPWHVTAFHPDYHRLDSPPTAPEALRSAREIGRAAGLRYVYAGNVGSLLPGTQDTQCPGCGEVVVSRQGMSVTRNTIVGGSCPKCGGVIAGRFGRAA